MGTHGEKDHMDEQDENKMKRPNECADIVIRPITDEPGPTNHNKVGRFTHPNPVQKWDDMIGITRRKRSRKSEASLKGQ